MRSGVRGKGWKVVMRLMGTIEVPSRLDGTPPFAGEPGEPGERPARKKDGLTVSVSGQLTLTATRVTMFVLPVLSLQALRR